MSIIVATNVVGPDSLWTRILSTGSCGETTPLGSKGTFPCTKFIAYTPNGFIDSLLTPKGGNGTKRQTRSNSPSPCRQSRPHGMCSRSFGQRSRRHGRKRDEIYRWEPPPPPPPPHRKESSLYVSLVFNEAISTGISELVECVLQCRDFRLGIEGAQAIPHLMERVQQVREKNEKEMSRDAFI